MRKLLVTVLLLSLVGLVPAQALTAKAGAKCSKAGAVSTVAGKKFTCIKSAKKLVWNKGVAVKKVTAIKAGTCPQKLAADQGPGITQVRANALLTMTEMDAEACATSIDWLYRVGDRDGQPNALTLDYRIERVTVAVVGGIVTKVDLG